jgi:hypothetical protein
MRLDLEIQVPDDTPEIERDRLQCGLDSGAGFDGVYTGTEADCSGYRWSVLHQFSIPTLWSGNTYNSLSHKHRLALKELVIGSSLRDLHLKSLWKHVGKMTPVEVYWTVVDNDRHEDVSESADQDEYNRIMLSPLEQLASQI